MKLFGTIFAALFVAAILASAKAIVDVEVLKSENITNRQLLIEVKNEQKIIRKDIKSILGKL